jgi:hypothetical protein
MSTLAPQPVATPHRPHPSYPPNVMRARAAKMENGNGS